MKKRGFSWIVVVTVLSSALTLTGANSAQAASTLTTTTMTPSASTPTYGDLVTFTVTVTPAEYSIYFSHSNYILVLQKNSSKGIHK